MSLKAVARRVITRAAIPLTAATLSVAAAGCNGDSVTAPDRATAVTQGALVEPVVARALLRVKPLLVRETATATIGRDGGTLVLRKAGLRVDVPAGALDKATTIRVTANPGRAVAYTFEPHGTVFNVPLAVTQQLSNTAWQGIGGGGDAPSLEAAYFADDAQLTPFTTQLNVNEILPVTVSGGTSPTVSFNIHHFSGYIIATAGGHG